MNNCKVEKVEKVEKVKKVEKVDEDLCYFCGNPCFFNGYCAAGCEGEAKNEVILSNCNEDWYKARLATRALLISKIDN
jgi:hypothetical protein